MQKKEEVIHWELRKTSQRRKYLKGNFKRCIGIFCVDKKRKIPPDSWDIGKCGTGASSSSSVWITTGPSNIPSFSLNLKPCLSSQSAPSWCVPIVQCTRQPKWNRMSAVSLPLRSWDLIYLANFYPFIHSRMKFRFFKKYLMNLLQKGLAINS